MFPILVIGFASSIAALPFRREVPQEHSHEKYLTSVRASLALDNPQNLGDPVFALLGNAAAADGLGDTADPDCLQQEVADQAFTNAKAAGDLQSQLDALVFRALERNTGAVGQASNACTSVTATNPEIAAIQQHQDPASDGAAALNKEITLELASQISQLGGDGSQALEAGTFAPGKVGDATAAGNTCDDANDTEGCIFTQNLIVEDATLDEIEAAVAGNGTAGADNSGTAGDDNASSGGGNSGDSSTANDNTGSATSSATSSASTGAADSANPCDTADNSTSTDDGTTGSSKTDATDNGASGSSSGSGGDLQTFTGTLGAPAPPVTAGGRGFQVEGNDDFVNSAAALGRSCDVQHNQCANAANSGGDFSVGDCDTQNNECRAAIQ